MGTRRAGASRRAGSAVRSDPAPHVAIVGAGFSGTMVAVQLLGLGCDVTLIDRSGHFAEGLAYGTTEAVHRLNVRASGMSAFPDDPEHFVRWLRIEDGDSFAPRHDYCAYLREVLDGAGRLRRLTDEAVAVAADGLLLGSGDRLVADALVVASGNLAPEPLRWTAVATFPIVNDPWSVQGRAVLDELAAQGGDILVVGTGLTMVDTVLSLDARGFGGRIVALSRRGLVPRSHAQVVASTDQKPEQRSLRELLRWVRSKAQTGDWRAVIDSLRPLTATIWQGWTDDERARFLRHLRPWWDVHRHRIAPDVSRRLDKLFDGGRLVVHAGRIVDVESNHIQVRFRGERATERLEVAGLVNCTGPQGDLRRGRDRFVRDLLGRNLATTDAHGLGLDVDADLRILSDAHVPPMYAIGPMTRGVFWETVAVPDIRVQAQRLAEIIARDLASARPLARSAV